MRALGGRTPGPGARAVLMVAGCGLLMVLVAWGTLVGPSAVFTGPGPTPSTVSTTTTTTTPPIDEDLADDSQEFVRDNEPPLWVKLLVWTFEILVLVAMVACAAFLLTRVRHTWQRRAARPGEPDEVDFATLDEPARLAAAITDDAAAQDAVLRDGEPRNAIVAAWQRFEVQGARAGVERQPWETSSEFALRMLERVDAESSAVNRLAGLYREARFSDHEITEVHRADALAALEAIRRTLGVRP